MDMFLEHNWAKEMRELLTNTNNKKKQLVKDKIFSFTDKQLNEISDTYSNIIEKGYSENDKVDLTYIKDKIDELNLIKRLDKFMERALRMIKGKTKVSGEFRSSKDGERFGNMN